MPSDDVKLCSASGARHGMAPKVLCAFLLHAATAAALELGD